MEQDVDTTRTRLSVEIVAQRWKADDDGGFAILVGLTDEGEEVTLTGALAHVHTGESLDVTGAFRRHPKHGWRFACEQVRIGPVTSGAAIIAYLASVKHVGPKGAAWLLERHGPEVLVAIDADPGARLGEVPGIGRARLGAAVRSWQDQAALREARLFLEEHGVPAAVAARIYRVWGAATISTLREDPYALTGLERIGFATADALARALGTPTDAPGRLDAGLVHALAEAELDGHCHLPREELLKRGAALLGASPAMLEPRLQELSGLGRLIVEDDRVADARMHAVEQRLARRVRELAGAEPALEIEVPPEPPESATKPTPDQWAGVARAVDHRLSILTGLPGTGKTATMKALVDLLRSERKRVRLCAPTGKAAKRLAETTGADATTIHRLLEFVPGEGFARDAADPITGADMLIVDEASMLDVRLAGALLDAVGPRTHVLLVGDVDQLAPVGPGRVLEDLIESEAIPVTRLTEIFRQAARSLIVRAAHAINRGQMPPTTAGPDDIRDFFVLERSGADAIRDEVVSLATQRLPSHYGLDATADLQVLAPMHKGPVGVDTFNAALRERLNLGGEPIPGTSLRLGDKVLQTRNNHERSFYNGELAVVVHHNREDDAVVLACDDGRRLALPIGELDTIRLAFASTIHKAQGSQHPAVVVVVSTAHHVMLTRNLLYTAITRSQRVCVVVGERAALATALDRLDARRRYTRLAELTAPSGARRRA